MIIDPLYEVTIEIKAVSTGLTLGGVTRSQVEIIKIDDNYTHQELEELIANLTPEVASRSDKKI
jgi:hypothetical protein